MLAERNVLTLSVLRCLQPTSSWFLPGVVAHAFTSDIREAEAG